MKSPRDYPNTNKTNQNSNRTIQLNPPYYFGVKQFKLFKILKNSQETNNTADLPTNKEYYQER